MQKNKYRYLLYFITLVITVTLAIQVYWNYKNYQAGKQQLVNEMQISLDQAVDNYYIDLADRNTIGFASNSSKFLKDGTFDTLLSHIDISSQGFKGFDSIKPDEISNIKIFSGSKVSQMDTVFKTIKIDATQKKNAVKHFLGNQKKDSSKLLTLANRIIIAITTDTLDTPKFETYLQEQLSQKKLDIPHGYLFKNNSGNVQSYRLNTVDTTNLKTQSKSAYLPKRSSLVLYFSNINTTILKRNLLGIVLSAILVSAVIACLLFLVHIINKQKQLSEIKNDLISNITHEFKTPIATIGVALEGIANFNTQADPKKTKSYVHTSNVQLNKLNIMVEKLLETATLDGDDLNIQKKEINLDELFKNLIQKHQSLAPQKHFLLESSSNASRIIGDFFHLENAFNNILDNAAKYGGDDIKTSINHSKEKVVITIRDSGNELTAAHAKHIFEKFYRVPHGNIHNVKGFGIGLYYTKKIIARHHGTISINLSGNTTFIITLPNG